MKAVVCETHGGSDLLKVRDAPAPVPGPGQVVVRVRAAAVNPAECKMRQGTVPFFLRPRMPWIPGFDIAGDVEAIGPGVTRFAPGAPVFGLLDLKRGGGYAELAAVSEQSLAAKPASLGYEEAAAIPVCGLTSLQALRNLGGLQAGSSVAVNGAAGGVGTFAVQIARALGASVTGTCGSDSADLVRSIGATAVVDYKKEDFTRRGDLYDVIFDTVATRSFGECARALKPRGTYVTTVPSPALVLLLALLPPASLVGYRKRAKFIMAQASAADLEFLGRLCDEGKLRPVIDRVFPLEDARSAHDHVETGHAHGKVVLRLA